MTDSAFLRRALWATIATLLVASALAGAVIGGGEGDGTSVAAGSSTTTSTIDDGGTGGGDGGDAGATGEPAVVSSTTLAGTLSASPSTAAPAKAAGGATTTTAAPAAPTASTAGGSSPGPEAAGFADIGAAADGGAVRVPAAGTYPYATKAQDKSGQGTITVEDKGDAGNGARNLVMSLRGLGGFDSVNDVTWGTGDVKILKSAFSFGAQSATCDWEPDYVELKLPLAKGASWDATSSCTVGAAIVKRSTTNTVADARRVRVAGQAVDVWLITGTERIEFNGQVEQANVTTWFSGKHGLIVKSVAESSRGTSEYEIQNLTPQ